METWRFREQLLWAIHRWYLILIFVSIGGLVGYLFGYLLPSPYQATANLYIGINIERVNDMEYLIPLAKEEPLNLDDYKNWQLKQVADIVFSKEVVQKTLNQLAAENSDWNDWSLEDFRKGLDVYWYDTGTWQLRTKFSDKEMALSSAETWLNVSHKKLSDLLLVSTDVAKFDAEIQTYNQAAGELIAEKIVFESYLDFLQTSLVELESIEDARNLSPAEYQTWKNSFSSQQIQSIREIPFTEDLPDMEQSVSDIILWLKDEISTTNSSLVLYDDNIQELEDQRNEVIDIYHQALEDSLGLSANLVLEPTIQEPELKIVRSVGQTTLGGGVLGLLSWIGLLFVRIQNVGEEDE